MQRANEEMKCLNTLGYDLKTQRMTKGMSQSDVARYCNVSLPTYQRWENGTTKQVKNESYDRLKEVLSNE